jgi:cell pole-organizing protein PopZ
MSGSQTPSGQAASEGQANPGGDPSMEDILASIRRILSEDETAPAAASPPPEAKPEGEDVLVLDPAMMVTDPAHEADPVVAAPPPPPPPVSAPSPQLVAPETAAAAISSVEGLVRTLSERTARVSSNGPTIEDIVREELRPLLKSWLDINLPPLVERLVRAEIERVVGRAVP